MSEHVPWLPLNGNCNSRYKIDTAIYIYIHIRSEWWGYTLLPSGLGDIPPAWPLRPVASLFRACAKQRHCRQGLVGIDRAIPILRQGQDRAAGSQARSQASIEANGASIDRSEWWGYTLLPSGRGDSAGLAPKACCFLV